MNRMKENENKNKNKTEKKNKRNKINRHDCYSCDNLYRAHAQCTIMGS